MKTTLVLFFVALSFGLICGDDKPAKAKDAPTPAENVICKKCNCDVKAKVIECSNKALTKMFSFDDWAALNATSDDYEVLKLDHNQFENIDVAFPALRFPLKVIDFRHNKINQIVKNCFTKLDYLEEIDLSFNELTTEKLKPEIFEGKYNANEYEPLMSMKRLKLSYNLLHNFDDEVFEHLKHLQELYIDNNPFQIIHTNVLRAFTDLDQLHLLDMSRMELSSIPFETFHPLRALKVLKLDGNLFKIVPDALKLAINVRELSLNENPLLDLSEDNAMPIMPKLQKLNMTYIGTLRHIGKGGMTGLESLEELDLSHNHHLSSIDPDAFVFTEKDNSERKQWPLIKKLFLNNNNLSTIDVNSFIKWKEMKEIHIHDNPWLCDCQLQWVSSILMPVIKDTTPHLIEHIKCAAPHQMVDRKLLELSDDHSEMRCLDKYGANPERDSALLVALLIGVLLGMPLAFATVMIYKRGCGRRGPADYSRAFYKRAEMQDDAHI